MKKGRLKKIGKILLIIIIIIGGTIMFIDHIYSSAKYNSKENLMEKIKKSPQYYKGKFRNGARQTSPSMKKAGSTMWEYFFKDGQRVPEDKLPVQAVDITHFSNKERNHLSVTWLGHSSLMINIDGYKILVDPVFEKKVSPLGPTRFNGETPLDINNIPHIDLVIITHNHYDHLNKFSIQKLKEITGQFMTPLGVGAQLEHWGITRDKIIELDWWEEYKFDNGLTLAATPSQHFSGRGLSDRNKTLWASWVVWTPEHKVFLSGDSGYFDGFKKIGDKYGPFDMTFIECGAYNANWHSVHMFPEETVKAHLDLNGKILHPIHWGTFNLSLHSWDDPMKRLYKAASEKNIKITTPIVGETSIYGKHIPTDKWWELKNIKKIEEK